MTHAEPTTTSARRGRVLVVDDERAVARGIARVLGRLHDVEVVDSARDACTLLEEDDGFDVILTDLLMPGFSGMDLYLWVKADRPHLLERVAFMTGGVLDDEVQAFVDGVDSPFFDKPMEPIRLREAIAGMVTASRGGARREAG
ncbi:MAG: response regulator [Myxococcota bacterium]